MSPKRRESVPSQLAAEVAYLVDRKCAVCGAQGIYQLHHLDDNPSNNTLDNLIVLCPNHHAEATCIPGMTRKLDRALLSRYRAAMQMLVKRHREALYPKTAEAAAFNSLVDAVAVERIRMVGFEVGWADSKAMCRLLRPLTVYGTDYGLAPRLEVLGILELATIRVRSYTSVGGSIERTSEEMGELASAITNVATAMLQGERDFANDSIELPSVATELIRSAQEIGRNLIDNSIVFDGGLSVANEGASLLWQLMRMASRRNLGNVLSECSAIFDKMIQESEAAGLAEISTWLRFKRAEGTDENQTAIPYPNEIAEKIYGEPGC